MKRLLVVVLALLAPGWNAFGQQAGIVKNDTQIDGLDPAIKIFLREKMAQGNTRFANDNIVLFLHGATGPSTCDFDLQYKDYSWADWLVKRGYVVYMGDYRNYGGSTREKAMDEPAGNNQPVTRSYLALRDIEAMVDHIKRTRGVQKISLIGWSWGAMMAAITLLYIARTCKSLSSTRRCTISMTTQISALAAVCKISASQRSLTLRSALIVLPLKRLIQAAGMAKFPSKTKTNIAMRRCPANSGRRVSLPTPPAIRGHLQVCGHQMVSLKIHSIRRPAVPFGMPPISMRRRLLSPDNTILGLFQKIAVV